MSRIGKKLVSLPDGVSAQLDGDELSVKGPKGLLAMTLVEQVNVDVGRDVIKVTPRGKDKISRSMWGLQRSLIDSLVEGVSKGFEKKLTMKGVGYRAAIQGKILNLKLGYSHDIDFPIPDGIKIECPDPKEIVVSGIDKQKVGQVAAVIRGYRKPEPYKGHGIKYENEYVFRKEGKKK